jgi:cell shape-determining protein MreC
MLQSQLLQLSQALRKLYSDETLDNHDQEMAQLQQENKDLRELLKISKIEDESSADRGSPVIHVARTGVVEEYFSSDQ